MISIIDYGSGNFRAIGNIYDVLNIPYKIVNKIEEIENASKIILPGVGAFDQTMSMLNSNGFREILDKKVLLEKVPILGICVGMQMLADSSEEGTLKGLGWIRGKVKKFDKSKMDWTPKLPHLGWNSINILQSSALLSDIDTQIGFYFIHSYYFEAENNENVLATTEYGDVFHAAIVHNNIYGVQFHPEKSHKNGIQLLKNFALL